MGIVASWSALALRSREAGAATANDEATGDNGVGGAPANFGGNGGNGGPSAGSTAKRLAALRKKVLKDDDFVENDETNRDPFHSYMRLFVDRGLPKTRKVAAIFDRVGLDELTLIAIVSGDENPRAMFRDPSGFGQSVKTGDFLSRVGARVTKILSDRVIVEVSETRESGQPRVVERAILVNPGEAP